MVEYSENIIKAVTVLLVILLGLLISKIITNLIRKVMRGIEINRIIKEQLKIKLQVEENLASFLKYLIYFITAILALNILGIPTKILQIILIIILILTVLFIILAFKDWVPNLVSGFYILKSKKLKKGDKIKMNNIEGKIIKVNFIETKIETNNKEIIFIPNSNITKYEVIKHGKSIRTNTNRKRRRH